MPPKVTYANPDGACEAQGLYSHLTVVPSGTDLMFVAGQLAVGEHGEVVGVGDFRAQFAQVHKNLGDVLRAMGADWNDVIQFRTYLVHSQDIPTFMELRAALFPKLFTTSVFPPNTLLTVDRLVKEEFLFEVEAVVAGPGSSSA
ncbi:RidA family protein [Pseudonocardia bannensis]|uniref:RidA family protein n=1 Tax=Pseudonocardia bannensis TaxID=630973 RepID=A0A848DFQ9_9PSEU|nr:RidA family protein [Pseudonocardia bannensis]NMH91394.1 RidA family protein [Pseudonocardia bannensis]